MPSPRSLAITIYRAALLGGAAVGIVDGARAAQLGHLGGASLLSCVALVAGFDVLIGAVGGVVLAGLLGLGAWGRQRASRWAVSAIGWLLVGGLAAIAPVVALVGTANRNNRFLAAGIAALASLVAAVAAAVLGPALARALPFPSPRSGPATSVAVPAGKPVTAAGLLLLAPLAVLLFEVAEGSLKHQGGSPEELLALLHAGNYLIYTFDRMTGLPVPAAPGVFAENMIGYPAEKPIPAGSCWSWPTQSRLR